MRVITPQHVAHIHPPAIRGERRLEPISKDGVFTLNHLAAQSITAVIQFGHMPKTHPGNIILIVIPKVEITSFLTFVLLQRGLKPRVHETAMVRNDIQHIAHVPLAERLAQRNQRLIPTQNRVHLAKVAHIVAVIGIRGKNRVEVERVDPQALEIVQMGFNPRQVAAIKRHQPLLSGSSFAPGEGLASVPITRVCGFNWIVTRVTVGKSIGKNLVKNGLFEPRNRLKPCQNLVIKKREGRV